MRESRSLCFGIVVSLLACVAGTSFAAVTEPHPALWRIVNGNSTVYIFGSFHILKKGVTWWTPKFLDTLSKADAFVFEAPVDAKQMKDAQAFVEREGYLKDGQSLSGLLSADARDHYQALLARLPLKVHEMDKQRPWLASLSLSESFYTRQRFSVLNGADTRIMGYAAERGKPVRYLETPRQQLEFFQQAAGSREVADFEALVASLDNAPNGIDDSTDYWMTGDVDEIGNSMQEAMGGNPEGRKILLDDRNAAWASSIDAMLNEGRTNFVTVGAGHLGGSGNLITLLCDMGWNIERIPTAGEHVDPPCPDRRY